MTDKTLQERLRGYVPDDGDFGPVGMCAEAADALDAQAERIKDLEDTERAYEELSQYLVGDKMIAPIAGVIALETRIKALEGALRDWINFVSPESGWGQYTRMEGSEVYTDAKCLADNSRALLGEK